MRLGLNDSCAVPAGRQQQRITHKRLVICKRVLFLLRVNVLDLFTADNFDIMLSKEVLGTREATSQARRSLLSIPYSNLGDRMASGFHE